MQMKQNQKRFGSPPATSTMHKHRFAHGCSQKLLQLHIQGYMVKPMVQQGGAGAVLRTQSEDFSLSISAVKKHRLTEYIPLEKNSVLNGDLTAERPFLMAAVLRDFSSVLCSACDWGPWGPVVKMGLMSFLTRFVFFRLDEALAMNTLRHHVSH